MYAWVLGIGLRRPLKVVCGLAEILLLQIGISQTAASRRVIAPREWRNGTSPGEPRDEFRHQHQRRHASLPDHR